VDDFEPVHRCAPVPPRRHPGRNEVAAVIAMRIMAHPDGIARAPPDLQ
jgi:hypothetical protein